MRFKPIDLTVLGIGMLVFTCFALSAALSPKQPQTPNAPPAAVSPQYVVPTPTPEPVVVNNYITLQTLPTDADAESEAVRFEHWQSYENWRNAINEAEYKRSIYYGNPYYGNPYYGNPGQFKRFGE